ncbi:MAG: HDOD domain-containing protein [Burkholderiaceae bacterium]|nr:HDOD domain-containing protein [Burkholderiaceae bacterium]
MQAIATVRAGQQNAPSRRAPENHVTSHPIDQEILKVRRTPSVRAIVIPPCPDSLRRLQDILAQSELDAGALDQLASSDVAMAAALIRQANSPLHGLAQPVQTVGMALTVLGLRPAAELLSAFITRHALQVHSPLLEHFWESSQRRAIACEHMGHQLYSFDPGLGYSFGLFCHVGMPVLVKAVRGYASTVTEALARKDRTFTQTENANHRTDHAVVGAIVARTWHLPGDVAQAIWLHHDFACLGDERFSTVVRQLVALGLLAEYLVNQHDGLEPSREWLQHGEACLQHLHVSDEELNHWIDELHPAFEAVGS